jgi:hypothetical protein
MVLRTVLQNMQEPFNKPSVFDEGMEELRRVCSVFEIE